MLKISVIQCEYTILVVNILFGCLWVNENVLEKTPDAENIAFQLCSILKNFKG